MGRNGIKIEENRREDRKVEREKVKERDKGMHVE